MNVLDKTCKITVQRIKKQIGLHLLFDHYITNSPRNISTVQGPCKEIRATQKKETSKRHQYTYDQTQNIQNVPRRLHNTGNKQLEKALLYFT